MQHSVNSIRTKKHYCQWLVLLCLVLIPIFTPNYASGTYFPANAIHTKNQYVTGKVFFSKIKATPEFSKCLKCYAAQNSLQDGCTTLNQCVSSSATDKELTALKYFLKKRYRLE